MLTIAFTLSILNLFFVLGGLIFFVRLYKNPKDDPRMARGLQILQSKISVIEDLSKQIDKQSEQVFAILEVRVKEIQDRIHQLQNEDEKLVAKQKELKSIIKIFQDRVPFEEIAQRQMTVKYVKAAKMAHQGKTAEEIARLVELPQSELDMICKLNREQLLFSEKNLPEWLEDENKNIQERTPDVFEEASPVFEPKALAGDEDQASGPELVMPEKQDAAVVPMAAAPVAAATVAPAPAFETGFSLKGDRIQVQKVSFPSVHTNRY